MLVLKGAKKTLDELIAWAMAQEEQQFVAYAWLFTGRMQYEKGQYAEALDSVHRAAEVMTPQLEQRGDAYFPVWGPPILAGDALWKLGRTEEAIASYRQAIDVLDALRDESPATPFGQTHFFQEQSRPYIGLVELLTSQGKLRDALVVSDRVKARTLNDALVHGRVDLSPSLTPDERAKEKKLESEISRLNLARLRDPRDTTQRDLETARLNLVQFTDDIYLRHPDVRRRRVDVRDPLARIHLQHDSVLLDYVVGEHQTTLFVISPGSGSILALDCVSL